MAFPISPKDGQIAVVNNIAYTYDSANSLWYRTGPTSASTVTTDFAIVSSTANSTSTTTGALIVAGGVGIGGSLSVGGNVTVQGFVSVNAGADILGANSATFITATITSTSSSTSTTTGALIVAGGVGVGGNINFGGNLYQNGVLFTGGSGGFNSAQTIGVQTGTSYTLVLSDAGKLLELSNASGTTVTIPPESSVNFTIGQRIDISQNGTGPVTISPGLGVVLHTTDTPILTNQYSIGTLIKIASNEWTFAGPSSSAQGGGYINLTMPGAITPPFTGSARFYPPMAMTINTVYANLGATPPSSLNILIKKNGTFIGTTCTLSSALMTPVTVSIPLSTTDYLTMDVSGSIASDLLVKLKYI